MPLDEEKAWVLWPEYFDSARTRAEGRKVSRSLAIDQPTLDMVALAVKKLGLEHKVESDKAYPGNWYAHGGRVLVEKKMKKAQLLVKVAELMKRSQRS